MLEYRDDNGNSLLHILCQHACMYPMNPKVLWHVRQLLKLGFDPRDTNDYGHTSLDALIFSFLTDTCYEDYNETLPTCEHLLTQRIEHHHYMMYSFVESFNALLPWFNNTRMTKVKLPQFSSTSYTSIDSLHFDFIKVYQPFLDKNIFPHAEKRYIDFWGVLGVFSCNDSCHRLRCEWLVEHLYSEMCKGLNLDAAVIARGKQKVTLPMAVLLNILALKNRFCHCTSKTSSVRYGSCAWSLMELMIHCKADLEAIDMVRDTLNRGEPLYRLLCHYTSSPPPDLRFVPNITKLIWMYSPTSKKCAKDYFQWVLTDRNDLDARNTVHGLQDLILTVRPLTLLCRLCILKYVVWTDVPQLPLPGNLKQYIQIGDISPDHVIHKVLSR